MDNDTSNWYGVKLVYLNKVVGEPIPSLLDENFVKNYIAYEESVVLIQADSSDHAYEKAETLAKENEDDYENIYGQTIHVRYYDALDCFIIEDDKDLVLKDGLEVYSNIIESHLDKDPADFLKEAFPIVYKPKYMLLNKEFSRSNAKNSS